MLLFHYTGYSTVLHFLMEFQEPPCHMAISLSISLAIFKDRISFSHVDVPVFIYQQFHRKERNLVYINRFLNLSSLKYGDTDQLMCQYSSATSYLYVLFVGNGIMVWTKKILYPCNLTAGNIKINDKLNFKLVLEGNESRTVQIAG